MDSPLQQGMRLGRYRLLAELGHGGMASVWVALERTRAGAERFVALKVMLPRLATQSNFRAMFLDEGQLVRSIEHPNVVRVFEVGEDHGMLYMAMEWVEGDSLHGLIRAARKRRAIPPEMAVRIIADVAAGLHQAHELRGWDGELRGVVHCDVSPQNILIGVDGQPKLVDFGVAHAAALSEDDRNQVRGKLGYMSPEQAYARELDRRSDIFSMGIVLFELTTGKRLFGRRDPQQTLALVRSARVPIPSSVWPDYPEALGAIVLKSLQRDPRHRYQTAEELKLALEHFLVENRTMVSPAGVASLLSRVLGERIKERRVQVQQALDVQKATIALPRQELASYEGPTDSDEAASSGRPSDPDGYFEIDSGSISIITEGTGAQSSQRSVVPHVVETPPAPLPRGRRTGLIVAGAAVVVLGVGLVVLAWPSADSGAPSPGPKAAEAAPPGEREPGGPTRQDEERSEEEDEASDSVPLDSMPIAKDPDEVPRGTPRQDQSAFYGSGPNAAALSHPDPARQGGADGAKVDGKPVSDRPKVPAGKVDMSTDFLDEQPTPSVPTTPSGDDLGIDNPYR